MHSSYQPWLGSTVTNGHAWEWVVICISQRDYKGLHAVVLAVHNELRKDSGDVAGLGGPSYPPLSGLETWGVYDEGFACSIVGRFCLDFSDIGSMSHFSQRKAPDH